MTTTAVYETTSLLHRFLQWSIRSALSITVTLILFLFMCSLIDMEAPELIEPTHVKTSIYSDPEPQIDVFKKEPPVRPLPPEVQPAPPQIAANLDFDGGIDVSFDPPVVRQEIDLKSGSGGGTAVPIFRVAPMYPPRAQRRGIEGYVDLLFDIDASGKTNNIRVLAAEPTGYFERSAKRALAKWKYRPAEEDGRGKALRDQRTRLRFNLDS